MAEKTFNIRLQIRSDTEQNFNTANPVLLQNELVVVTEVGDKKETKMKLGDGVTAFSDLEYIETGSAGGGGAVDSVNGQTGVVTLTASDVGALASNGKAVDSAKADTATTLSSTLAVAKGGTGATVAKTARLNLGVNKIFYGSTTPTDAQTGDIWLKTL